MTEKIRGRLLFCAIVILALFALLAIRLAIQSKPEKVLLSADAEIVAEVSANKRSTRTITLQGERAKILGSDGQPLAYNQPSYDIEFFREDESKKIESYRPYFTEIMLKTIEIVERNGGTVIDTFAIAKNDKGNFEFNWIVQDEKFAQKRHEYWIRDMFISSNMQNDPERIYHSLRSRFYIPEDVSYEQARKLLSIWQEIQLNSNRSYIPIKIATNVSFETVAEIETRSHELEAIQTVRSSMRIYPKGELVSHIIGYTSRVDAQSNQEKLFEMGYFPNDRYGVMGVESAMEQYLTGSTTEHQGKKVFEVSARNKITREIEFVPPTNGNDVVLTIDLDMQQVLQKSLENTIKSIRAKQEQLLIDEEEKYAAIKDISKIQLAEVATGIVINISNGKILAMGNYPSFDNNALISGLTPEYSEYLFSKDGIAPMTNRAISYKTAPGSIFKMITAIAGLEEKVITVDTLISDEGPYALSENADGTPNFTGAPKCWIGSGYRKHNDQDVVKALKNSCNYYFFKVADGLTIARLSKWANLFGLDSKTDIELTLEATGQIGGQTVLFDNLKGINEQKTFQARLVSRNIQTLLRGYCEIIPIETTDEDIERCATRLVHLVTDKGADGLGDPIRQIMREELGIPEVATKTNYWTQQISSELSQLVWNLSYTVRTGIGQGVMEVTPIAAARYAAALVNGGNVYDTSIIDRVIDENGATVKVFEPKLVRKLDIDPLYLAKIKEGMEQVFSEEDGGSAGSSFVGFEYRHQIGGKTGTAQVSVSNNVDLENTSWMIAFLPIEKPEIAIVVCIPHGKAGSESAPVVKDIAKFYLDRKNAVVQKNVPSLNGLLPG